MDILARLDSIMENNIDEARNYIQEMYESRAISKTFSDLCKEMAMAHLNFNVNINASYRKMLDECAMEGMSERQKGRLDVYQGRLAKYNMRFSELRGMIENCK